MWDATDSNSSLWLLRPHWMFVMSFQPELVFLRCKNTVLELPFLEVNISLDTQLTGSPQSMVVCRGTTQLSARIQITRVSRRYYISITWELSGYLPKGDHQGLVERSPLRCTPPSPLCILRTDSAVCHPRALRSISLGPASHTSSSL